MARDDLTPSQLSSIEEIELLRKQLDDALAEIRRLKPLEQQLAQAQQRIDALQRRDTLLTEEQAYAVTRYVQARALLERTSAFFLAEGVALAGADELDVDIAAFLAEHPKEHADG